MTKINTSTEIASSAEAPLKLFCWNFQTKAGGWGKGWGGYARQSVLYPLSDDERETGAVYIRADQVAVLEAERDAAIARAEAAEALLVQAGVCIRISAPADAKREGEG